MAKKLHLGARVKNFFKADRQIPDEDAIRYQQGEIPDDWMRTPSYFDSIKKPPDSGMGYVQSPYTSWYTKVYGVVPIADYSNYRSMYRTVPIIKAAIDTTVNCVCGKGFDFVTEDDDVKEYITDYFNKLNSTELLHVIAHDCLVYGNAFVELCYEKIEELDIEIPKEWIKEFSFKKKTYKHYKGTGKVVWLKPLDAYYMRCRRDMFGNIFGFVQWIAFPPVSFSCEKMAHFKYLPKSWSYESAYGTSSLMSLIKVQDYIWQLERDFQAIVHTFAKPIMAFYGGTAEKPFGKLEMASLKNAVKQDGIAGKYFLRGDCVLKTETSPANLIGISNWFNYLNEQRLAPLGVPPVLMGMTEGTNRATAQVTFADFVTRVKMLQSIIADVFEDQILPKILKPIFGDKVIIPKMVFKEIFTKDYIAESARVREEFTRGIITKNEAREALGYKPTDNSEDDIPITLYQYGMGGIGQEGTQEAQPSVTKSASFENKKKDFKLKHLGTLDDVDVFVVDSAEVANQFDKRWDKDNKEHVIGNQHYGEFSDYIPENEVWISDLVEQKDIKGVLFHELVERTSIKKYNIDYDTAHELSINIETYLKENDEKKIAKKIRRRNTKKPDDKELIRIQTAIFNNLKEILAKSEESVLALVKKQVLKSAKGSKKKAQDVTDFMALGLFIFTDYELSQLQAMLKENIEYSYKLGESRAEDEVGKKVDKDNKDYIDTLTKNSIGYVSGLNDEMQDRLRTTIADGIKEGLTYPELSVKIQEDFDFAENRAKLISITETERVNNNAYISSAQKLGIEKFIWNISPDDKVCEICMALDGEEIDLEESFDAIPEKSHPSCRCFLSSYIED